VALIVTALLSGRLAGRYDAHNLFIALVAVGVCDDQKYDATHQPNGLPALFAIDDTVRLAAVERIVEHLKCQFKADMMLDLVRPVFGLISFKRHHGGSM
jgi:hypothetical protein